MFIPKGKRVYGNLATSYVLVDSLVDDLCEGGFSGVVELTLRDSDAYIVIEGGRVTAVVEKRAEDCYVRRTVAELASRSRGERGKISVFRHPPGIGSSIARRLAAKPLYTQLSTEFADLGKMIAKLGRERDRHWFIEVTIVDGNSTLVHIAGDRYEVIPSAMETAEDETATWDSESALRELLRECERAGGTFDVYFTSADEDPVAEALKEVTSIEAAQAGLEEPGAPAYAMTMPEVDSRKSAGAAEEPSSVGAGAAEGNASEPVRTPRTAELSIAALASTLEGSSEAAVMAEVKKLMGEIARAVEDATRTVEQRDCFSMYLRAGQLKIADQYRFLDPFGAEFEYLGGEIAFIGEAKPEDFIKGLTEAMRLAVVGVAESSAQPARLRACIIRDLRQLLEREREAIEKLGLDHSIEQIITA